MDIFTLAFWIITGIALIISIKKDKKRTIDSLFMAKGMMKSIGMEIIGILFLIGLILSFIPPETVEKAISSTSLAGSTIISAVVGSITLIPAFVAFPLVGTFLDVGVSIVPAVAFLTTLTMVGVVTFSLEKREFGVKFSLTRNLLSFVFAIMIAFIMGGIL